MARFEEQFPYPKTPAEAAEQLPVITRCLKVEAERGHSHHWAYDLTRHDALIRRRRELMAIIAQQSGAGEKL